MSDHQSTGTSARIPTCGIPSACSSIRNEKREASVNDVGTSGKRKRGCPPKKQALKKPSSNVSEKNWDNDEIEALLHYLEQNFNKWLKGNKTKFYNNIARARMLPGRDKMQIKNKLSKLRDKYMHEKDATNSTGVVPLSWKWFSKMEEIFGQHSNIEPEYQRVKRVKRAS
jgi:hypothetical protein